MLEIIIQGEDTQGSLAKLAVQLEYFLMTQNYEVRRGVAYDQGLTDIKRAEILKEAMTSKDGAVQPKPVGLEVYVPG